MIGLTLCRANPLNVLQYELQRTFPYQLFKQMRHHMGEKKKKNSQISGFLKCKKELSLQLSTICMLISMERGNPLLSTGKTYNC